MARIVVIGEGMIELSRRNGVWQTGIGGDTLNLAVHLARLGQDVAYLTALGTDPFSKDLKRIWAEEGIDTSLVLTHPNLQAGLYAIETDAAGERRFFYWRESSAAREMFALPGMNDAFGVAAKADLFIYSLITLAILPPEGRDAILAFCRSFRAGGGRVAFDGNYRPRLWPDRETAALAREAAVACADIGLPTLDDEILLDGKTDADAVAARWQSLGCTETVVKLGAKGCRLSDGTILPPTAVLKPIDTSGAGDAFNGGYLAARMSGLDPVEAAKSGHRLAGHVIMAPGAIPDEFRA